MKLNNIYIISWFGNNPEIRESRVKMHDKQLAWVQSQKLTPVILAQHYNSEEYQKDIEYIKVEKNQPVLLPAGARNVLLEKFYASDDDFALFADNDTIFYGGVQHGDSSNFIEIIRSIDIDKFQDIDIVQFTNPARTPFSKKLSNKEYKSNLIFNRNYNISGGIFLIKNLRKYHNTEYYYDDEKFTDKSGNIINGEDLEFTVRLLMHGIKCYSTYNVILNELGRTKSTWAENNQMRSNALAWAVINERWNREFRPHNRFDWTVLPNYEKIKPKISIPKTPEADILTALFDF